MSSYVVNSETMNAILTPLYYDLMESRRVNMQHEQLVKFTSIASEFLHSKKEFKTKKRKILTE